MLHHRSKAEGSQYRGSSDIAAGIDTGFSLAQANDGHLTLDIFKSRMGSQFKIIIEANFAEGRFIEIESPEKQRHAAEVAKITAVITENPGISVNEIADKSGIRKLEVSKILHEFTGTRWSWTAGPRKARCYSIIDSTSPLVRPLAPEDPSEGLSVNQSPTGTATGATIGSQRPVPVGTSHRSKPLVRVSPVLNTGKREPVLGTRKPRPILQVEPPSFREVEL